MELPGAGFSSGDSCISHTAGRSVDTVTLAPIDTLGLTPVDSLGLGVDIILQTNN